MPGSDALRVQNRADKNLFVTKRRKEASDYAATAQGGVRELLNVIASRQEVSAMQFDVDSRGFKTQNPLTGIVVNAMTPKALANFNTWLPEAQRVKDSDIATLNPILRAVLTSASL